MEVFSVLLGLCVANSPVTGEFPLQVASYSDVFHVGPHELLNKQPDGSWFATTWCSCDVIVMLRKKLNESPPCSIVDSYKPKSDLPGTHFINQYWKSGMDK